MLKSNLSQRGSAAAASLADIGKLAAVMEDIYDPRTNPDGIVFLGLADNALLRAEILDYLNGRPLHLVGPELTYADRICAQSSLLAALAHLFNEVPDGLDLSTFQEKRKPLKRIEPEHIVVGTGATGVLDSLFFCLGDEGDGVLVSSPWYNGFDRDLTSRIGLDLVDVTLGPVRTAPGSPGQPCFDEGAVEHYEAALVEAKKEGKTVRAVLLCNPHNPTGAVISRKAVVELCKFAAKHKLHLISDEIYSRSIFATELVEQPNEFYSVLSIDTLAEAGLDPSYVHVISSSSKDFSTNGFRLGVLISQHNKELRLAMLSNSIINQTSSVAGALWRDWILDEHFLTWYLAENRRRLRDSFEYVARFLTHHEIPVAPANAGHFCMVDLSRYLSAPSHQAEADLLDEMIKAKVFIAPGAQYHVSEPGFFRLTFSQPPPIVREGLSRLERVLQLQPWIKDQPLPVWHGPSAEVLEASNRFRDALRAEDLVDSASKLSVGSKVA
ncbi:hypothetical protein OC844_004362 [Tilletia horrida]|nr:hypothetical protein OC844_004362 [Tilletia horrida]